MKINLPIFKDEDTKDALTYQSWRWQPVIHKETCHTPGTIGRRRHQRWQGSGKRRP